MNKLTNELIKGLLPEEEGKKTIGVFGGGFKPPTKGHFEVLKKALDQNPEIDEMLVLVGKKERDGITQEESLKIWEIYGRYLPFKVKYIKATKPPIQLVYNTAKENPEAEVLWVIGAREESEDDFKDIASRTSGITKYSNLELRTIITKGAVSGTAARNAAKVSKEKLDEFLPEFLSEKEKQDIFVMLSNTVTEINSSPSKFQDFFSKETQHWINEDIKDYGGILEYKIDLDNIYDYSTNNNLWEFYDDVNQVKIIVKLKPTPQGVFEFKFYSLQDDKQLSFSKLNHYNPKVMNTVFKIFIDEVLPNNDKILIQPFDYTRYRLFRALLNKNLSPQNYNIKVKDNIETPVIYIEKKSLNENASYSQHIDIKREIAKLTKHMIDKGMNILPLPQLIFKHGDVDNATKFLGKTAYYDPNIKAIVLYTEGRHPKDIVRSYAHEMIHHIQNLEDRLGNITTTNTQEDGDLDKLEQEANLKGTMTFRNWTDTLMESTNDRKFYPFKITDKTYDEEDNSLIVVEYKFTTPNNIYRVEFYSGEYTPESKTFDLSFGVDKGELNTIDTFQMTGEGNVRKIFSTLLSIIEDFIDNESVEKIVVDGTTEKRKRIYKTIFSKTPSKISDKIKLKEAIVGDKIECDNCDWSWNIVDGGDDLYICHKCGHDNEPIMEETLLEEEDKLMAEVVNPDGERFEYEESNIKGLYTYKDSKDNLYFARITYSPSSPPRFEFKVGWFEGNDISKPKYEPQLPPNTTGMDNLKRRNTVAKIYRDEVLPYLKNNQKLAKQLDINPISDLRYTFSKRLVQRHTPQEYNIDLRDGKIVISLSKINEKKTKDPFGINAYAMELGRLREEETEYKIYCDMDGVIADFERGYEELTGIDLQGEFKPEGEEFWNPISKAGVGFWAGLKWMSDGKQLWDYIKQYKPELLSAPSREKSSRIGKAVWVKHKLPGTKLILRYAKQKKELASPNSILIDDRIENIKDWESAGGIGILHTSAANTISQLKKLGL